jgi:hypothetical protein
VDDLCALYEITEGLPDGHGFLEMMRPEEAAARGNYLETVQGLAPATRDAGVEWLAQVVETLCARADDVLASTNLLD